MFDNLRGYLHKSRELLEESFKPKFIDAIESRSLFLPETALRKGLEYKLSESKIKVKELACTIEGIDLVLELSKLGGDLVYTTTLIIEAFEISSEKHEAVFRVTKSKLIGDNLWGKVIAGLVGVIIKDIAATAIGHTELAKTVFYDTESGIAKIDLHDISFVEKLYTRAPIILSKRMVDFVQIKGCDHEIGGLRMQIGTIFG